MRYSTYLYVLPQTKMTRATQTVARLNRAEVGFIVDFYAMVHIGAICYSAIIQTQRLNLRSPWSPTLICNRKVKL